MYSARPVVPANMARAKRIAKRLHQIYPAIPLSVCQATTAHLFFHKDWHALEQAVANQAESASFDEDLDDAELVARVKTQYEIVSIELGQTDPNRAYPRPEAPASKSSMTEEELAMHFMEMRMQTGDRELASGHRYHQLLAIEAISEICPTSKKMPKANEYMDLSDMVSHEVMARLPAHISQWWSVNIPYQPAVAAAWATLDFDPNNRISVLNAGGYWGVLCLHYADVIDWGMCMGVACLFALRYGMLCTQDKSSFVQLINIIVAKEEGINQKKAIKELDKLTFDAAAEFFDVFARDDFADVFRGNPSAFIENAKDCLKIFSNPKSKKGTWNH